MKLPSFAVAMIIIIMKKNSAQRTASELTLVFLFQVACGRE
jgi:hypothetical protein